LTDMSSEGHFLYFAFGSNLLRERLRLLNPSAEYHCTAKLQDYSLRFGHWGAQWNSRWHGGVATIEELKEAHVWGVVWKISNDDLPSLDEQEGVPSGIYRPLEVSVETEGGQLRCRTYQLKTFECSLPSPPYKKVLCLGAHQNCLPPEYIQSLEALKTNGYAGPSLLDDIKWS
ncbi:gamma-glutamylcyclotransferase-like, partial [Scleropages formosus]